MVFLISSMSFCTYRGISYAPQRRLTKDMVLRYERRHYVERVDEITRHVERVYRGLPYRR